MGNYLYTMRKATRVIHMPEGGLSEIVGRIVCNTYEFAYRSSIEYRILFDAEKRRRDFIVGNAHRTGSEAFEADGSGFVVCGTEHGMSGCSVYADVTSGLWYDCDRFPGRLVGWLHKEGRKWVVRPYGHWHECQIGTTKEFAERKVHQMYERRDALSHEGEYMAQVRLPGEERIVTEPFRHLLHEEQAV